MTLRKVTKQIAAVLKEEDERRVQEEANFFARTEAAVLAATAEGNTTVPEFVTVEGQVRPNLDQPQIGPQLSVPTFIYPEGEDDDEKPDEVHIKMPAPGSRSKSHDPTKIAVKEAMRKARRFMQEAYDERMDVLQQDLADQVDMLRGDCLGTDRYFNTYWVVRGLPGVLVERCDLEPSADYAAPLNDAIDARTAASRQARGLSVKRRHLPTDDDEEEADNDEEQEEAEEKPAKASKRTSPARSTRRAASLSASQSPAPDSRSQSATGDNEDDEESENMDEDADDEENQGRAEEMKDESEDLQLDETTFAYEDPNRGLPSHYDARHSFFFKLVRGGGGMGEGREKRETEGEGALVMSCEG